MVDEHDIRIARMDAYLWYAIVGLIVYLLFQLIVMRRPKEAEPEKFSIGEISLESLRYYCGYDYSKPNLISIEGEVYDVTSLPDYAPGKPLHTHAGREVARAIALDSINEKDLDSRDLTDLTSDQVSRLEARKEELKKLGCSICGSVVPLKALAMTDLEAHNGSDPALPIFLAIEGVVYNVSKGRQFYGPDGVYPFAGRECARAFALLSTEVSECNKNLSGLR